MLQIRTGEASITANESRICRVWAYTSSSANGLAESTPAVPPMVM
jgi:hypothetical protein